MVRKIVTVVLVCLLYTPLAIAAPSVSNGDFSAGLTDWTVEYGTVTDGGGFALFEEDAFDLSSTLSQVFTLSPGALALSFDIVFDSAPGGADWGFPPDAFTASLLDPLTLDALIFNPTYTDFYYQDNTGLVETVADITGNTVSLDVSSLAGYGDVLLSFDLWGGDDGMITSASIDNISVSVIPAPGALLLGMIGSGLVGVWRRSRIGKID